MGLGLRCRSIPATSTFKFPTPFGMKLGAVWMPVLPLDVDF